MSGVIGVVTESFPGERRVALTPSEIPPLAKAGLSVLIERGAGTAAGFSDNEYVEKGASLAGTRAEVFPFLNPLAGWRCCGFIPLPQQCWQSGLPNVYL